MRVVQAGDDPRAEVAEGKNAPTVKIELCLLAYAVVAYVLLHKWRQGVVLEEKTSVIGRLLAVTIAGHATT